MILVAPTPKRRDALRRALKNKDGSALSLETVDEHVESETDERRVYLKHGRTLAVASEGLSDVIDIRASSGQLELRINLTEDGPVLSASLTAVGRDTMSGKASPCTKASASANTASCRSSIMISASH